eukprot:546617-Pelagomonas_calceolata.AAC.5
MIYDSRMVAALVHVSRASRHAVLPTTLAGPAILSCIPFHAMCPCTGASLLLSTAGWFSSAVTSRHSLATMIHLQLVHAGMDLCLCVAALLGKLLQLIWLHEHMPPGGEVTFPFLSLLTQAAFSLDRGGFSTGAGSRAGYRAAGALRRPSSRSSECWSPAPGVAGSRLRVEN